MSSDDDLRLNTLHRFSKQSSRLTLQEYSHCEVPAGCGGVVLRWVAAGSGAPIRVGVTVFGEADVWLDGTNLPGGYTHVTSGAHVLAIHVTKLGRMTWQDNRVWEQRPIPCAIAVDTDPGPGRYDQAINLLERARIDTRRCTHDAPPPGFHKLAFDDAAWSELDLTSVGGLARFALPENVAWRYERLRERGAMIAALAGERDEAWIRVRFTLAEHMLPEVGGAR